MQVTKNICKGQPIENLSEILTLAKDSKSVVIERNGYTAVRPAAFIQNWNLVELSRWKFFYSVKNGN